VGEVLAGTGLEGRGAVPEEAGLLGDLEKLGFGIVAYACTTCNGMSGALDPKIQQEIIDRDLYATAVLSGNRNFDGRIHPYAKQAFLASPPLVVAYAIAGTVRFDIEKDVLGGRRQGNPPERHLAERRRNRRHRGQRQAGAVPQGVRSRCSVRADTTGDPSQPAVRLAPTCPPTSAARRTGKARWPPSAR
jgi:hypothetical protein